MLCINEQNATNAVYCGAVTTLVQPAVVHHRTIVKLDLALRYRPLVDRLKFRLDRMHYVLTALSRNWPVVPPITLQQQMPSFSVSECKQPRAFLCVRVLCVCCVCVVRARVCF